MTDDNDKKKPGIVSNLINKIKSNKHDDATANPEAVSEILAEGDTVIKVFKIRNPQKQISFFQLFKTADGKYGWRLIAMNHEPVGRSSQDYVKRDGAEENAVFMLASWRLLNGIDIAHGLRVVKDNV